jgi:hypothetical protein
MFSPSTGNVILFSPLPPEKRKTKSPTQRIVTSKPMSANGKPSGGHQLQEEEQSKIPKIQILPEYNIKVKGCKRKKRI